MFFVFQIESLKSSWGLCCLSSVTCVRSDALSANVCNRSHKKTGTFPRQRLLWLRMATILPDVCLQLPAPPESLALTAYCTALKEAHWNYDPKGHTKGLADSDSPQPSGGRVKFIWTKQLKDEHQRHLESTVSKPNKYTRLHCIRFSLTTQKWSINTSFRCSMVGHSNDVFVRTRALSITQ